MDCGGWVGQGAALEALQLRLLLRIQGRAEGRELGEQTCRGPHGRPSSTVGVGQSVENKRLAESVKRRVQASKSVFYTP